MTKPANVDQATYDLARQVLTRKELDAWKLSIAGMSTRRIGLALNISLTTVMNRLAEAERKLAHADRKDDAA